MNIDNITSINSITINQKLFKYFLSTMDMVLVFVALTNKNFCFHYNEGLEYSSYVVPVILSNSCVSALLRIKMSLKRKNANENVSEHS